jgi:hypothetical protein
MKKQPVSVFLIIFCCSSVLSSLADPAIAHATSAAIQVSGNEGHFTVTATGTFSTHIHCTGSGENEVCTPSSSGTLNVYHQNNRLASVPGNGSASWSETFNAAIMSNGEHTYTATACDSDSKCDSMSETIEINNLADLSVSIPSLEGDMGIRGIADFKENPEGLEGRIEIWRKPDKYWVNYSLDGSKSYDRSDPFGWTYKEIVDVSLNAGSLSQGDHLLKIIAIAENGSKTSELIPFIIDNTPDLTADLGDTEGDMELTGTVDFKENPGAETGTLKIWKKPDKAWLNYSLAGSKVYTDASPASWSYEEVVGSALNAGALEQGDHLLQIDAIADNGAMVSENIRFSIDNKPDLTVALGDTEGNLGLKGTVDFKENLGEEVGTLEIWQKPDKSWLNYSLAGSKVYTDANPADWSYEEIIGSPLNAGELPQGDYLLQVKAVANNGATTSENLSFTVDNTPDLTARISDTEGDMELGGSVDFKRNPDGLVGTLKIWKKPDKYWVKYSLDGSREYTDADPLDWTYREIVGSALNAGALPQGDYLLQVQAVAENGAIASEDIRFTIDNTPGLTAEFGATEGDMKLGGTVDFKENPGGETGTLKIWRKPDKYWVRYSLDGSKVYTDASPTDWSYEEIVDSVLDAGALGQGDYLLQVEAIADNGAVKAELLRFTIDNQPLPEILGPQCYPDNTFDILGRVKFKDYHGGEEGRIEIYLKTNTSSYKKHGSTLTYEGTDIKWKYSDFTLNRLERAVWAKQEITIKIIATAHNGAAATAEKGVIIPALGCPK